MSLSFIYQRIIKGLYYYFVSHIILLFHYDKKYITGQWFNGKCRGVFSLGWRWLVIDFKQCRKMMINLDASFPVSPHVRVVQPQNIVFHPDDLNNFQSYGIYLQAFEKITIGHGTYIGPNVGIITQNHDIWNPQYRDVAKAVTIGEKCWIGMNSVILPGVSLGNHVVVGAGSIVTKSFPEGNCVIAGNPARIMKKLDERECNE